MFILSDAARLSITTACAHPFDFAFIVCSFPLSHGSCGSGGKMSLFFNLLRILTEENLEEIDEEEILEMLENEDWEEIEEFLERKTNSSGKVLH